MTLDIRWLSVADWPAMVGQQWLTDSVLPYRIKGISKPSNNNDVQPGDFYRHFGSQDGVDLVYCWTLENQKKALNPTGQSAIPPFSCRDAALIKLSQIGFSPNKHYHYDNIADLYNVGDCESELAKYEAYDSFRKIIMVQYEQNKTEKYILLDKFQDCDLNYYFRLSKRTTFDSLSYLKKLTALRDGYIQTDVVSKSSSTMAYASLALRPTNRWSFNPNETLNPKLKRPRITKNPKSQILTTEKASNELSETAYLVYIVTLKMYAETVTEDKPQCMTGRYVGICGTDSDRCNVTTENYKKKHETLKRLVPMGYIVTKMDVEKNIFPETMKNLLGGLEYATFRRVCRENNESQEHGCRYVRGSAFAQDSFGEPHRMVEFGVIDRAMEDVCYQGKTAGQKFGASA